MDTQNTFHIYSWKNWELAALISLLECPVEAESLQVSSGLLQSRGREKCHLMHTREQ